MCGVMADMQIISKIMKTLMPKISEILEEKEENCGDFIGNNLINQGLNNIFTNDMLNNETSLLIWDILFLEGNTILIKSILALYACLEPVLIKSKRDIENFKKIIDVDLKNIKPDNDELINYLFIKQFDFDEDYINEERFKYSIQISEAFETDKIDLIKSKLKVSYDKQLDIQLDKTQSCNLSWPYCVNDTYFENVPEILFYTTLSKQKIGDYIDDYFFDEYKKRKKEQKEHNLENGIYIIKNEEETDRYNISIERRPHYCSHASEEITNNKKKEGSIGNNIDINKEIESNININSNNNEINEKDNDKDKKSNNINEQDQNSNKTTGASSKSDPDEVYHEEDFK
jgi:hypothetical protein